MQGVLDKFIGEPALFCETLWREYILDPLSGDGGDLYISLPGQAFDKGVYQSKGYIKLSRQSPLGWAVVIVYLFKELKGSNVLWVHLF